MVAHVEVGGGGGTPPQGQGLGTGLRSGFGPEQNDDDEQGYEGEEGQWVENDTSSNCNSPPSFSPTITSSSTPAIASRIAAFEHNVSLGSMHSSLVPMHLLHNLLTHFSYPPSTHL